MDLMALGIWAWPKARPQDLINLINLINWLNVGSGLRPDPKFNGFNGFGPLGLAQGQAPGFHKFNKFDKLVKFGVWP